MLPAQEIVVQADGGTVGQDRQFRVPDTAYAVNERDLFFLSTKGSAVNATVGRYLIDANGVATDANDPTEKLPLQQLLDEIAPLLSRPTAVPRPPIPATPR